MPKKKDKSIEHTCAHPQANPAVKHAVQTVSQQCEMMSVVAQTCVLPARFTRKNRKSKAWDHLTIDMFFS